MLPDRLARSVVLGLTLTLALAPAQAFAPRFPHGANYVPGGGTNPGPGDTVPAPPPGAGQPPTFTPSTPGSGAPGHAGPPVPGQPSTPAPAGPVMPTPAGPQTPYGAGSPLSVSELDAASWELWWSYERHHWLALRSRYGRRFDVTTGSDEFFIGRGASTDTLAPSRDTLAQEVVPTLVEMLKGSGDVLDAAVIALAKSAKACEAAGVDARKHLVTNLRSANPQIAEASAYGLGMLREVELLEALLAGDTQKLRTTHALELGAQVPYRLRAAAAYALGAAAPQLDLYRQLRSANALRDAIGRESESGGNVEVAAACALALGALELPAGDASASALEAPSVLGTREHLIAALGGVARNARNDPRLRAQAAAAQIRQVGRLAPEARLRTALTEQWIELLDAREVDTLVRRSVVAALPWLAGGGEEGDRKLATALHEVSRSVADAATRSRALIALGEFAGLSSGAALKGSAFANLSDVLERGPSQLKPWAALALGIAQRTRAQRQEPRVADVSVLLRTSFKDSRSPYSVGALALALGLDGDPDNAALLSERLDDTSDPAVRGYLCLGLGLVDARTHGDQILGIVRASRAQPSVLASASLALGLLTRKDSVVELVKLFTDSSSQTTQAGLAQALGLIGDVRAIGPLAAFARDDSRPALARAFAIVALGGIASDFELPWNHALARRVDYLGGLPVLASPLDGRGVLDIL